jgi:hypothetical protein
MPDRLNVARFEDAFNTLVEVFVLKDMSRYPWPMDLNQAASVQMLRNRAIVAYHFANYRRGSWTTPSAAKWYFYGVAYDRAAKGGGGGEAYSGSTDKMKPSLWRVCQNQFHYLNLLLDGFEGEFCRL